MRARVLPVCDNAEGPNAVAHTYYKFVIFARFYFRETSHMRSFAKVKFSQNGKIILPFTDIGKSCPSREFKTSLICI